MINASQIQFEEKIYGDPSGQVAVYKGWYYPVNPDGQTENHQVAIKELKIPADNQSVISGLMQEITIQLKLEGCDFVCKCFGYFTTTDKIYIVSELLDCDLDKDMKMRQGRPYDEKELMEWLYKIIVALDFARKKDERGQRSIRLVDFGSGAIADGKVHKLTGTPLYMSPEQIPILQEFQRTGQLPETKYNPFKSDVYSLGVTFLQMALMEPPVQLLVGNREEAIATYLIRIQQTFPILHMVLEKMLKQDPGERPDFPSIAQYLKGADISSSYYLTVKETASAQCQWCNLMYAEGKLQPILHDGTSYNVCQGCWDNYYSQIKAQEQFQASQEQYLAASQGQYQAAPQGQFQAVSQGQYPPASQGQYPPASQGQYPPASQGQYPPASQGQYPPAPSDQYQTPSPEQYAASQGQRPPENQCPNQQGEYSSAPTQFAGQHGLQTQPSQNPSQQDFLCGQCGGSTRITVQDRLEIRLWFCAGCFSPGKIEPL